MKVLTSSSLAEPLHWVDIPFPKLRAFDVRVAVRAVGVNPVDWKMRQGDFLGLVQRIIGPAGPLVCGVDFAGEVIEIGPAVKDIQVGDRVVGGTDFSRQQYGSYAEVVQVRADQLALLPKSVAFEAAACLPVAGVMAEIALFSLGKLASRREPRVLTLGAAGGVGHFCVQLARLRGAVSVGVCSARHVKLVEELGGIAIDYGQGDFAVQAAQHGPYDVVVDAVGSTAYPVAFCRKLLKKGGIHVLVMPTARDFPYLALPGPTKTKLAVAGRALLEPLVAELAAGRLRVVIQERIPLGEAERAQQLSRTGKVTGKLVLFA